MRCSAGNILPTELCSHNSTFWFHPNLCIAGAVKGCALITGQHYILHGKQLPLSCPSFVPQQINWLEGGHSGFAKVSRDWRGSVKNRLGVFHLQGGGFVVHHGHNLSQRWRAKSQRDCHPQHMRDPVGLAGEQADRMQMSHCHLRQVGRCGDLSRASLGQGKCKWDFSAPPTIAAVTLLAMEGSCSEASDVSYVTQNEIWPIVCESKGFFQGCCKH